MSLMATPFDFYYSPCHYLLNGLFVCRNAPPGCVSDTWTTERSQRVQEWVWEWYVSLPKLMPKSTLIPGIRPTLNMGH